jgi:hypothetical protein
LAGALNEKGAEQETSYPTHTSPSIHPPKIDPQDQEEEEEDSDEEEFIRDDPTSDYQPIPWKKNYQRKIMEKI